MSNCVECGVEIIDEVLMHAYRDPRYPDIHIGPYCINCIKNIKVCSGCHKPFISGLTYLGGGIHYCDDCVSHSRVCNNCGNTRIIESEEFGYCGECVATVLIPCKVCDNVLVRDSAGEHVVSKLDLAKYPKLSSEHNLTAGTTICEDCFRLLISELTPKDVITCPSCYRITSHYDVDEKTGVEYCEYCFRDFSTCKTCGYKGKEVCRVFTDSGYILVCNHCAKKLKTCDVCGLHHESTELLDGFSVCIGCRRRITDKGLSVKRCKFCLSVSLCDVDSDGICGDCIVTHGVENTCTSCGRVKDTYGDCRVCGCGGNTKIYNYTLKPRPRFMYNDGDDITDKGLFLGIENEVTFNTVSSSVKVRRELYENFDPTTLICKSDASIRGVGGFEIVTQPMSFSYFNKNLEVGKLFSSRMSKSTSCGMHVHISRGSFKSDVHILKVISLIYEESDSIELLERIFGRGFNSYSQKIDSKFSSEVKCELHESERTNAVNLTNKDTIEFRMFAGCTREFEMRYRVEFLIALILWASVSSIKDCKVNNLVHWILKYTGKSEYLNIKRFLRSTIGGTN